MAFIVGAADAVVGVDGGAEDLVVSATIIAGSVPAKEPLTAAVSTPIATSTPNPATANSLFSLARTLRGFCWFICDTPVRSASGGDTRPLLCGSDDMEVTDSPRFIAKPYLTSDRPPTEGLARRGVNRVSGRGVDFAATSRTVAVTSEAAG